MSTTTEVPVLVQTSSRCSCCERSLASVIQTFEEDCASFPLCLGCLVDMPGTRLVPILPQQVCRADV